MLNMYHYLVFQTKLDKFIFSAFMYFVMVPKLRVSIENVAERIFLLV
jgi:hypothetical protein